jgi:hypothetical protein
MSTFFSILWGVIEFLWLLFRLLCAGCFWIEVYDYGTSVTTEYFLNIWQDPYQGPTVTFIGVTFLINARWLTDRLCRHHEGR